MKKYKFSLKDEAMMEEVGYHPNFFDIDKEEILVPKEFLDRFQDGKVYNEDEFYKQGIVWDIINDCELKNYGNELDWTKYKVRYAAIPKQKVDDTELWIEALRTINKWSEGTIYLSGCIQELQKHYAITRK